MNQRHAKVNWLNTKWTDPFKCNCIPNVTLQLHNTWCITSDMLWTHKSWYNKRNSRFFFWQYIAQDILALGNSNSTTTTNFNSNADTICRCVFHLTKEIIYTLQFEIVVLVPLIFIKNKIHVILELLGTFCSLLPFLPLITKCYHPHKYIITSLSSVA